MTTSTWRRDEELPVKLRQHLTRASVAGLDAHTWEEEHSRCRARQSQDWEAGQALFRPRELCVREEQVLAGAPGRQAWGLGQSPAGIIPLLSVHNFALASKLLTYYKAGSSDSYSSINSVSTWNCDLNVMNAQRL